EKFCKWCGQSSLDVEWTRGGQGCTRRKCQSYLQWNCSDKDDKAKLEKKIETGGAEAQKEFREERGGNSCEDGSRRPKRPRKSISTKNVLKMEGKMKCGVFWPKHIYEKHFSKKLPPSAETSYKHGHAELKGIVLSSSIPFVDGCIELSSTSAQEVHVHTELPANDPDSAFKKVANKLKPTITECNDSSKAAGDANGNYLNVKLSSGKRRKRGEDSDDEDYDPYDALFGPILSGKSSKGQAGQGNVGGEGGDRKKRADAEQLAKTVLLESQGVITRLEDEQMVHGVTTANVITIKKKLNAALGPDKIKILTAGSEELITGASGTVDNIDRLLGELNDVNSKIDAAAPLVAKLQSKGEELGEDGESLLEAMSSARSSGLRVPESLTFSVLNRGLSKAAGDKDYERAAAVVQWGSSGASGAGAGVSLQVQVQDPLKAAVIQEKLIMRQLLDTVRTTDTGKPDSVEAMMKTLQGLSTVKIIEDVQDTSTFKPQLDDMAKMLRCMPVFSDSLEVGARSAALTEAAAAKTKISEDRNHRFHKIFFFLPAGRHITARIDEQVLQSKQDIQTSQNLDKLVTSITNVPLFTPKEDADLRSPITIDNRKNLKTFCINVLELDGKLSEEYKQVNATKMKQVFDHRDAIVESIVAYCRSRQKLALEDAVKRVNQVLRLTDGLNGNVDGEIATQIVELFERALSEFAPLKQLGISDIFGTEKTKQIDEVFQAGKVAVQHIKEMIPSIVEVSKKKSPLDVRTSQLKGLAEWFVQLGPTGSRVASWSGTETYKFEKWLKTEVTRVLIAKVVQTITPFQSFAKRVAEWLDKTAEQQGGVDPTEAILQDSTAFAKEIFVKDQVGEVTELASLARLDVHFDKYAKWLGVGFNCSTAPVTIRAGLLILSQPILHVGQRVVRSEELSKTFAQAELAAKGDPHIKAIQEVHSSVQFVVLAERMVNSVKSSEGLGPGVLERALSILKVSRERFQAAVSAIIDSAIKAGDKLIVDLKQLKATEALSKLCNLSAEGDFTTERIQVIMDIVKNDDSVKFYRTFKKSQKAKICLDNIRNNSITVKDVMGIELAVTKLNTCIDTYSDEEYADYNNMMGILLCSQTIWRDLQPGESRDALADQCAKTVQDLTIPAPLAIALKQLATKGAKDETGSDQPSQPAPSDQGSV
ncbi:unnamed protein product, partial [Prorocentrum cordatum]